MKAHPWFKPRPRRVGIMIVCVVWLAVETWLAPGTLWFWMILALTGYGFWDFFLSGNYDTEKQNLDP